MAPATDPVSDVRSALAAIGVEPSSFAFGPDEATISFSVALTGLSRGGSPETIAVPSAVGRLGYEFLNVVMSDGVARYVARRLPLLGEATLRAFAAAARTAIGSDSWHSPDPTAALLIEESERILDRPLADGDLTVLTRHAMRTSRIARDAGVAQTLSHLPGIDVLVDPEGAAGALASRLRIAA